MKTLFHAIYSLFQIRQHSVATDNSHLTPSSIQNKIDAHWQEDDSTFIISVPVPGLNRKDLLVYLNGRALIISSKGLVKGTGLNYSFALPVGVDKNRILAKCRHGILTIKAEKLKHEQRIIKVTSDEGEVDNALPLKTWWGRLKKKLDLPKSLKNVRMIKSSSG